MWDWSISCPHGVCNNPGCSVLCLIHDPPVNTPAQVNIRHLNVEGHMYTGLGSGNPSYDSTESKLRCDNMAE